MTEKLLQEFATAVMPSGAASSRLLVFLPCLNEAQNLPALLSELTALPEPYDVLVVDDGSSDDTAAVAAHFGCTVLRHHENRGLFAAVRTAVGYALQHNYDFCLQIDGDGQHDPLDIARFLACATARNIDAVIGNRYHACRRRRLRTARAVGSMLVSLQLRGLFGVHSPDPLNGMRMLGRRAMHCLLDMPESFPDNAVIARFARQRLSMQYVPIQVRPRRSGVSYIAGLKGVRFLWRLLAANLHLYRRGDTQ